MYWLYLFLKPDQRFHLFRLKHIEMIISPGAIKKGLCVWRGREGGRQPFLGNIKAYWIYIVQKLKKGHGLPPFKTHDKL